MNGSGSRGRGPHSAAGVVGPVYPLGGLATWKDVTGPTIMADLDRRPVLGFRTLDDVWLFPSFQFGRHGEYRPDLPSVLVLLDRDGYDPTTAVLWMNQAGVAWDGLTPAQMLRAARVAELLSAAAEIDRARRT
jgi:hypothetical protein